MIIRYANAPEVVTLSEQELLFLQEPLPFQGDGTDKPLIDFIARTDKKIDFNTWFTKRVVLSDEDNIAGLKDLGEFEISYNFPDTIRNNVFPHGVYGKHGITMRMLYEMLCGVYNLNEYFVDRYFDDVFLHSTAYTKLKQLRIDILTSIAQELFAQKKAMAATMGKKPSQVRLTDRYGRFTSASNVQIGMYDLELEHKRMFGSFGDFDVWSNTQYERELQEVGEEIRQDIIRALSIGEIPLQKQALTEETIRKRIRAGIRSEEIFYASGRLIDSIQIFIVLDKEAL